MTIVDMRESMLGVGSAWFLLAVLPCAALGLAGRSRKTARETEAPEDSIRDSGPSASEGADRFIDWWCNGPRITPESLKIFIAALLSIELLGLTPPQMDMLTLPEMIRHVRAHPYGKSWKVGFEGGFSVADVELQPRLTYLFMPNLNDSTADGYAAFWEVLRMSLLVSWCAFLAMPYAWAASWFLFLWGVVVYVVMSSLTMMYVPVSTLVPPCYFLAAAACVAGSLEQSHRAQAWLGKFLLISDLTPYYLSSGLSKLRYAGWTSMMSGGWLRPVLTYVIPMSVFPSFNDWVLRTSWAMGLMSFGVLLMEFVLPVSLLYLANSNSDLAKLTRTCWIALAIFFHIATYLVVGPNFVRQVPLLLMLLHGVWHPTIGAAKEVIEPEQRIAWRWRVGYATALLLLFLCAQVWSDISHIVGATPHDLVHDMNWPIPEVSMFVSASASSHYVLSLFTEIGLVLVISLKMSLNPKL